VARHTLRFAAGICIATLIGIFPFGIWLVLFVTRLPGNELGFQLNEFMTIVAVVSAWSALYLAIPAGVAIATAESKGFQGWSYHVVPAALIGIASALIAKITAPLPLIGLFFGALAGGIYWRIAGRHAGLWRKPAM
jgi:hypothetical protein